ncbi:MAG: hypothetical protein D6743_17940 [Calditrichaeota bacterium]|nr:MAG: hypothetical protein D6743_17940 [Calditrichota bacterium]
MKYTATIRFSVYVLTTVLLFLAAPRKTAAQLSPERRETVLKLMEEIFQKIPADLSEVDSRLKRIAIYRIDVDKNISPALQQHFENRLVEVFRTIEPPTVVSLPELNTLKISSTDTSFSIINTVPSPEELWRVGRHLRVDAFVEGNLVYVPHKALFLDLRLNRTGTNEVLWAKSYAAYETAIKLPSLNPVRKSISAGLEVFQVETEAAADSLLRSGYNRRVSQYSVYFGIYQYVKPESRLRYEVKAGISFLSDGVQLNNDRFSSDTFYSNASSGLSFHAPSSYNFRAVFYSSLVENKSNPLGDWLSVYFAITRYFTRRAPDLTGLGMGLRADLTSHFSISAGFATVFGSSFDSRPTESSNRRIRLKVNGLQYEVFLLHLSF